MYVQHKLAQQAQQVLALLQQPTTTFYICGLKGMETGILEALAHAAEAQGLNWPVLFDELKQQKRWHVEVY
jgi:sulfite reductase alpha subunit-like flavoprotein